MTNPSAVVDVSQVVHLRLCGEERVFRLPSTMSTRKKKSITSLQQIYDSIMELLLKVKPVLDNPKGQDWRAAVEDLNQVASLAESFSDQRPRSSKSWSHLANSLDQEGVNLWNISGLIGKCEGDDARAHLAACEFHHRHPEILNGVRSFRCGSSETCGVSPCRGRVGNKAWDRKSVVPVHRLLGFRTRRLLQVSCMCFNWQAKLR